MTDIGSFKERLDAYTLDPTGIHHELSAGMHGRKQDFDRIETGSDLYDEWVKINVDFILSRGYEAQAVIGVAGGTNRLALDVARRFGGRMLGLVSEKDENNPNILQLSKLAAEIMRGLKPKLILVLEDVGTTGSNAVQVAVACLEEGAQDVGVINTRQRRDTLECLDAENIKYAAIINDRLETYTPEECLATGPCKEKWQLIRRGK